MSLFLKEKQIDDIVQSCVRDLCTTPFTEQRKLALTRIERGVGGPSAQLSNMTSTLECLV